jgi:hypothetical protein
MDVNRLECSRVASLLTILTTATLFSAGCGSSPSSPSSNNTNISYGSCGLTPNYAASVRLHRFASFPVTVSVNVDIGNTVVPSAWIPRYQQALSSGAQLWNSVMGGQIGQATVSFGNPSAMIQMSVDMVGAGGEDFGITTIAPDRVISSAAILIHRFTPNLTAGPGVLERAVDSGTYSLSGWLDYLIDTVAHEMGHALFTIDHAPTFGNLMSDGGNFMPFTDPRNTISAADRNTMNEAYCR